MCLFFVVLCFKTWSHYVDQAGLEVTEILQALPPECFVCYHAQRQRCPPPSGQGGVGLFIQHVYTHMQVIEHMCKSEVQQGLFFFFSANLRPLSLPLTRGQLQLQVGAVAGWCCLAQLGYLLWVPGIELLCLLGALLGKSCCLLSRLPGLVVVRNQERSQPVLSHSVACNMSSAAAKWDRHTL